MVEKLFETPIVKHEGNIYTDKPLDKDAFFEQVYKKKKEGEDEVLAVSAGVAHYIQLPDSKHHAHGGGYFSAEDNVKKRSHVAKDLLHAPALLTTNTRDEHLRRVSILVAAKANGSELAGTFPLGKNSEKLSIDNNSIGISKNNASNIYVPLMQNIPSSQQVLNEKLAVGQKKSAFETTTANAVITTNTHLPLAELQTQRTEMAKGSEAQSSSMNAMLQKTMQNTVATAATGGNHGITTRSFDIDYQFHRWAGDHSVKVSIPTEARRDTNITLLPSDTRAADVLSRQMVHLSGHTPELLKPEQDCEERERHQQQDAQDQDEEQE
ncbi:SpaN/EivJ family type III secretion system needle length determinant [Pectobacterium brasiliense]|uniref:SpaN/EivJ family type III secretion system needle length determinant n=1 Tax=Pectobacterium brasiliense TaxID=180957 RepID=UPI0019691AB2|nr:type III secretion system needle length determinant, SpaN/EivJ family [Pectobacterium brasiliense]MBN3264708.1 hypothetical protein [Pectobacterium brasiliense]